MSQTVYIAGPMTGLPEWNYPAFHAAATAWRARGYTVINPAENFDGDTGLPREVYIRQDVKDLVTKCHAVAFLPGWQRSQGATLEHTIAVALGYPTYDAVTGETLSETILEEAQRLVYGDRQASYGHPIDDFKRTAAMWTGMLGDRLTGPLGPEDVALMMILVKVSRECHKPKRDNVTDIAGYAATLAMVRERQSTERGNG